MTSLARGIGKVVTFVLATTGFGCGGTTTDAGDAADGSSATDAGESTDGGLPGDLWRPSGMVGAPSERGFLAAVWTGSEMLVWGGLTFGPSATAAGGRYAPDSDTWLPISLSGAPAPRYGHTGVWTGSELIVWGGTDDQTWFDTGARYDAASDSWSPTSVTNAPVGRLVHTAVWTGSEMLVWGGQDDQQNLLQNGARYDPAADTWTPIASANAPSARASHLGVWAGSAMLVWGGWTNVLDPVAFTNEGARYDPGTDTWTPISVAGAPTARRDPTSVWTGTDVLIWGGIGTGMAPGTSTFLETGARYSPGADSWTAISSADAPASRTSHSAVWTGTEMIVWGGEGSGLFLNTGARYDPALDTWRPTSVGAAPEARIFHAAVWSGTDMIVWGGFGLSGLGAPPLSSGGVYSP